jgi:hypothetical protein
LKEAIFHLGRFGSTIGGMDVAIMENATVISAIVVPINGTQHHIYKIGRLTNINYNPYCCQYELKQKSTNVKKQEKGTSH